MLLYFCTLLKCYIKYEHHYTAVHARWLCIFIYGSDVSGYIFTRKAKDYIRFNSKAPILKIQIYLLFMLTTVSVQTIKKQNKTKHL